MADLQAAIQAAADEMVAGGTETGLQVAVRRHGQVVADVAVGLADLAAAARIDRLIADHEQENEQENEQ